ncbi:MAG TPA: DUF4446 family protein [Candidatus Limnocylindrales bacterium]|nr:DUF4446 family protein [Candidatus Limnocylindrales bacterium]
MPDPATLTPVLIAMLGVSLVGLVLLWRRMAVIQAHLERITRGDDGQSLQGVLETHLGRVVDVQSQVVGLAARTGQLEIDGRKAFQRIGLVRFNPFEDTGGNQSFALALLDAEEDGIIISSLHSRGATRIYAKAIAAGRPEAALSDEETEALGLARDATGGRVAIRGRASAGPPPAGRGGR